MSSQGRRLGQLTQEVAGFHKPEKSGDQNHRHYLNEASQFLRHVDDPLDVLRFLDKLIASPFAKRAEQKLALTDVCRWLASRLIREPEVDKESLAYELAWLQRLAVIRSAKAVGQPTKTTSARSSKDRLTGFRGDIEAVEKRRGNLLAKAEQKRKIQPPLPAPRIAPKSLPAEFEVVFADIEAARSARKNAITREKKGKTKKVSWLALKPVDNLLNELARGLSCTLDTQGCDAVFADMAERAGRPLSFWVAEIRKEENRQIVERIILK